MSVLMASTKLGSKGPAASNPVVQCTLVAKAGKNAYVLCFMPNFGSSASVSHSGRGSVGGAGIASVVLRGSLLYVLHNINTYLMLFA